MAFPRKQGLGKTGGLSQLIVWMEGACGRAAKYSLIRYNPDFEKFTKNLIGRVKLAVLTIRILVLVIMRVPSEREDDLLAIIDSFHLIALG